MSRNIAAPFQQPAGGTGSHASDGAAAAPKQFRDYIDHTNTVFAPLEPVHSLTLEKYCGPTPESNWVILGELLVGAYPASQSDVETFELLISILKLKVTTFVCLQQEYRTSGITEAMWRSGHALRPYFEDVKLIIKNKQMFKSLSEHPGIVDPQNLDFVHFPIRDCSISDDAAVLKLSQSLVARLHQGEKLYLHCWGGHGRTGTVVCIMLHLMYGMSAQEAMAYCQRAHDLRQCPVAVGSPQTETQRDQVTRVITALIQHRKNQARAAAFGPPPTITYPPADAAPAVVKEKAERQFPQKQPSQKDVAGITQETNKMVIDSNPRNNIAARATGEGASTSRIPPPLSLSIPAGDMKVVVASPPCTPPASSSGKRGGRNVTYTVAVDQSLSNQPQQSVASPSHATRGEQHVEMEVTIAAPATLPAVIRPTSGKASRPTSPSPLTTPRSGSQKAPRQELHPHVVTLDVAMEDQAQDAMDITHHSPVEAHISEPMVESIPPQERERLKSIVPDLVEGKAVKAHVGLYPMVRMPTEKMKVDLDGSTPPASREGRRRGSRSIAPNLGSVQEMGSSSRRMSAGTIMAHDIIMNAAQGPSPKSTAGVPVTTPPTGDTMKAAGDKTGCTVVSRANSNASDGHTSNSAASVGMSEEDDHASEVHSDTNSYDGKKQFPLSNGDKVDDAAMDIDNDSYVRPASPTITGSVPKAAPVLSSGASTFLGAFHKKS